jgi:thiosulfate dehydrogenase (quinone) large subunit
MATQVLTQRGNAVQDPSFVQTLLNDPRAGWFWLLVRIWLGYKWIDASLHKIGNAAWVENGYAVKGFWENAVVIPEGGRPAIAFDWYRNFIQTLLNAEAYTWLAPLIAYGELLVGIALIVGLFTGIAAFFGGLMNWNFMMAGAASSNPMLFVAAVALILAWKVAGYVGLDYFALPLVGTPWERKAMAAPVEATPVRA